MFYCGMVLVGNGPVLEISGGGGKALWASWKNNKSIVVVRISCYLFQNSEAFLKVSNSLSVINWKKNVIKNLMIYFIR